MRFTAGGISWLGSPSRNVTSMFTIQEARMGPEAPEFSHLGDNVLLLEMMLGDELTRTIRILKSRGSGHDGRRRVVTIGKGGLSVR